MADHVVQCGHHVTIMWPSCDHCVFILEAYLNLEVNHVDPILLYLGIMSPVPKRI